MKRKKNRIPVKLCKKQKMVHPSGGGDLHDFFTIRARSCEGSRRPEHG
jgi:hypothetical protein